MCVGYLLHIHVYATYTLIIIVRCSLKTYACMCTYTHVYIHYILDIQCLFDHRDFPANHARFPRSMEAMSRVVKTAGARTQEQLHATWTLGFPQYFQTNTICDQGSTFQNQTNIHIEFILIFCVIPSGNQAWQWNTWHLVRLFSHDTFQLNGIFRPATFDYQKVCPTSPYHFQC